MPRFIPLILAVALFMEQMDSTVIATSLPAIAADIGTSPVALKLAVTSYLVSLAIFIPISGWMADKFGSKNIFRLAIIVFVLGSIACGFSHSIQEFVFARFFQGVGGSMMTPVSRLLLVRGTPRKDLVRAMAWLTMPALLGPISGPPLGGFLTTYLSWHWVFWINVPISIIGLILVTAYLPSGEPRTPRPMDFPGFFLSAITFTGLVFGMSVISLPALPLYYGYISVAIGAVTGIVYLWHAMRAKYPLLDPKMFRYTLFRAGIVGGSNFRIGLGALPFLLPLMLQLGFGLSPFQSGLITFVAAIGSLGSRLGVQTIFRRFGFRNILAGGTLISSLMIAVNGFFTPDTPHWLIMACLLIGGTIRATCFTGLNAMVFGDVEEADSSQATAINSVAQQISLASGVAVAGVVLDLSSKLHGGELVLSDFHVAFFVVGILSAFSCLTFLKLPRDAGEEVSGHHGPVLAKE